MSHRVERDSMGEVLVPQSALYGAQTQRAADNFKISGVRFSREFIEALGTVKRSAARVNRELGTLEPQVADAIIEAAGEVVDGTLDGEFVLDIFQTGSGTSTNMNANEVIANRATALLQARDPEASRVHPNDHVNFGQSSNDTIPTAIRIAAVRQVSVHLIPAMEHLRETFLARAQDLGDVVKTGRTHLMDAMPVTLAQEFGGYARQMELGVQRLRSAIERMCELPQGGTAVGTGVNTHPEFGARFAKEAAEFTGLPFREAADHFEAQSTIDAPVELSGQLKTIAVGLIKIANDLRWMNSGPYGGLGEVELAPIHPGSSIMPGKVNPVIEESVVMVAIQVIGNDAAVTVAGQTGNFELNVALPVTAHNLLESIKILGNACVNLADRSVAKLTPKRERIADRVGRNPILVTALNLEIGYDRAAAIAKKAYAEGRPLLDVALEMTDLSEERLKELLDPARLT